MKCPLCCEISASPPILNLNRSFIPCATCGLVSVAAEFWYSAADELAHYALHQNSPTDKAYRNFLARLTLPLCGQLPKGSTGLDFGCGPGPTLGLMLEEQGYSVTNFDPNFYPVPDWDCRSYDFITATEVFEHLREPRTEIQRMWQCLAPGGLLAVMTALTDEVTNLSQWHYMRDPTHIIFWNRRSFGWLSNYLGAAELTFPAPDVAFLRKG